MGQRIWFYRRLEIWSTKCGDTKYFPACEGVSLSPPKSCKRKKSAEMSPGSLTREELSIPVVRKTILEMRSFARTKHIFCSSRMAKDGELSARLAKAFST